MDAIKITISHQIRYSQKTKMVDYGMNSWLATKIFFFELIFMLFWLGKTPPDKLIIGFSIDKENCEAQSKTKLVAIVWYLCWTLWSLNTRTRTMWFRRAQNNPFSSVPHIHCLHSHTGIVVATKNPQSAIHSHTPPLHCSFAAGDETVISTSKNDFECVDGTVECVVWCSQQSKQKARRQSLQRHADK